MLHNTIVWLLVTVILLISNASAAMICGLRGTHNFNKLTLIYGNFFYNGPATFSLCASYCRRDPTKCKSFRYSYWDDANAQYCEFFGEGL